MAVDTATPKPTTQDQASPETAGGQATGSPFLLWGLAVVFMLNLVMVIGAVVLFGP